MLADDDPRWGQMTDSYGTPVDPRPLTALLESETEREEAWSELWDELHHQGDVGIASYAAVPLLVEAHRKRGCAEWNSYAIVSIIDLARTRPGNPKLPDWLQQDYQAAIHELASIGSRELSNVEDADTSRAILSVLALSKGLRMHAKVLINYNEEELRELAAKL
jgi:hypothetical protein